MRKIISILMTLAFVSLQTGCATIVSGKTQDVMIRSNPSGATIAIDEIVLGTTPMIANLVRKKRHSIKLTKEGYAEVVHATTRDFNWWYIGNLVFGGIIGLIVDPCTGAWYKVSPEELNVSLPSEAKVPTTTPNVAASSVPASAATAANTASTTP